MAGSTIANFSIPYQTRANSLHGSRSSGQPPSTSALNTSQYSSSVSSGDQSDSMSVSGTTTHPVPLTIPPVSSSHMQSATATPVIISGSSTTNGISGRNRGATAASTVSPTASSAHLSARSRAMSSNIMASSPHTTRGPVSVSSTSNIPVTSTASSMTTPSTLPTTSSSSIGSITPAARSPPGVTVVPGATSVGRTGLNPAPSPCSTPAVTQPTHTLISIIRDWRWELFTWLLGTCAMVSVLALLMIFRDQPLRLWHSKVQISAIVAVMSQVAQSALLVSVASSIGQMKWSSLRKKQESMEIERFDEAMRGPDGSLKLILLVMMGPKSRGLKHTHTLIALAAALVTLLMLSFGTFTQQAVAINIRRIENSSDLVDPLHSVSRALSYMNSDFGFARTTRLISPNEPFLDPNITFQPNRLNGGVFDIDVVLSGALASGITSNHSLDDIAAQCSAEDCIWNSYQTLAVCSSVEDISSQLSGPLVDDPSVAQFHVADLPMYLNISLPIPKLYRQNDSSGFAGYNDFWMSTLPAELVQDNLTINSPQRSGPRNSIADVYLVYFPTCAATNNQSGKPPAYESQGAVKAALNISNWKAFKNSFQLCTQELTTSNTNGTTKTSIIRRTDHGPWQLSGAWEDYTGDSQRGAFEVVYYSDPLINLPATGRLPFSMDIESLASLADLMRLTLTGSAHLSPKANKVWSRPELLILAQDVYGPEPEMCSLFPGLGIDGFKRRMENIATSLTNTLRRNAKGIEQIRGSTFTDEQFIDVTLAWLAMPLAIWAVVTILLFLTIWRVVTQDLPSWKASTLPWLECRDPGDVKLSKVAMEHSARRTYIQMQPKDSGWYLARTT